MTTPVEQAVSIIDNYAFMIKQALKLFLLEGVLAKQSLKMLVLYSVLAIAGIFSVWAVFTVILTLLLHLFLHHWLDALALVAMFNGLLLFFVAKSIKKCVNHLTFPHTREQVTTLSDTVPSFAKYLPLLLVLKRKPAAFVKRYSRYILWKTLHSLRRNHHA